MCGIVGFFGGAQGPDSASGRLETMLSALVHRGPDEQGYYFDEYCGFGTARLSIIDLATGSQPISTDDQRYWIAFNGEIFNYLELREELTALGCVFRTHSDTEVLLQALVTWDMDALSRVNGQFAFLWYDRHERRLVMARDRFGERPLFYSRVGTELFVASEIKALFSTGHVPRALSPERLFRCFQLWTSPPNETCFEGVEALPPGHVAVYQAGVLDVRPYYRLPSPRDDASIDLEEAQERVRLEIERSVEMRMRSDVEVGSYLSGGLDSAITTLLARKYTSKKIKTFGITFDAAAYDESTYQQEVASFLETEHHEVKISAADIAASFPDVIWHAEAPLFRTAPVPMFLLSRKVQAAGIKVVLSGEGSDEAFVGYNLFREALFRARLGEMDSREERLQAVRGLYGYLPHFDEARAPLMLRFFQSHTSEKTPGLFSHEVRFSNGEFATRLLNGPAPAESPPQTLSRFVSERYPDLSERTLLGRAQVLEYETLLAGYLLSSQGDRMTSAHSVEGRCPFLDPGLVAAAFATPEDLKLKDGRVEKYILKRLYGDALPQRVIHRPKQPYRAPDAVSFLEGRNDWVDEILGMDNLRRSGLLDPTFTGRFLERLRRTPTERISPRDDHTFVLLLSTLLLDKQFVRDFPSPSGLERLNITKRIDGRRRH